MPRVKQRKDVESQTSQMKQTSPQLLGSSTVSFPGNQTGSTPVQILNDSKKRQSKIQRHELNMTANDNGDHNISPPKITTSQIAEQLVRDDVTNEPYMPLSSTIHKTPRSLHCQKTTANTGSCILSLDCGRAVSFSERGFRPQN